MHGSEESWSKQRGWEEAAKGHQEGAKSNRASKWRKTLKKNILGRRKGGWRPVETGTATVLFYVLLLYLSLAIGVIRKLLFCFQDKMQRNVLSNNAFCVQLSSPFELKSDSTNYYPPKMKAKVHHSGIQLINKVSLRPRAVQRL